MTNQNVSDSSARAREFLTESKISAIEISERNFPGESWLIITVRESQIALAQSLAGALETHLNELGLAGSQNAVAFRVGASEEEEAPPSLKSGGGLASIEADQLIQLLGARSRTSDALPSLKYVTDPRVGPIAIGGTRHHLIYGRRGVGKTALMVEAKRMVIEQGHVSIWLNAQTLRHMSPERAFLHVIQNVFTVLVQHLGTSQSPTSLSILSEANTLAELPLEESQAKEVITNRIASMNLALRGALRADLLTLYIFLDDFYLYPLGSQAQLLDYLSTSLRDANGWLKIASIERLTRVFEPSSRVGIEVPHDALKIDLDMTLEEPGAAQNFLEKMLSSYTESAGFRSPSMVAKPEALGRLVLASGAVPRDYLNLFAESIVVARESGRQRRQIGKEDVSQAAGASSRNKKRDLEQDVASENAPAVLKGIENLADFVKSQGYTYFLVNYVEKRNSKYDILAQIVDLRFIHVIDNTLSDQHQAGVRYEAYLLDLSEYTDVRLRRGLRILDLEGGIWMTQLSGTAKTRKTLSGTQLRDELRKAPKVDLDIL